MAITELVDEIKSHRCYSHPIFEHWAQMQPPKEVIGALFHHVRSFCDATRPGWNLPEGLREVGLSEESSLLQEIVESEEDHGPELATMAGHILNRVGGEVACADLKDQHAIESLLKRCSDQIMGALPGYDRTTGLMPQTRRARAVFDRRKLTDRASIYQNLGTTLALEIISNRHLIPGEKKCLVDAKLYGASLDEPEMHYLKEHFGESGAEALHEQNAIDAVASVLSSSNENLVRAGAREFLDSLTALWDLLDSALLGAGGLRTAA